ncbi:MAG: hypothetical protein PVG87_23710, partial [Desulfobacteraceae bacterium]
AGVFTKLNAGIIAQTRYIDTTARAAAASSSTAAAASATTYYYTITSVDAEGDESIQSAMVSPSPAAGGSDPSVGADSPASFGGGGGGCFIGAAKSFRGSAGVWVALVLAMLGIIAGGIGKWECGSRK